MNTAATNALSELLKAIDQRNFDLDVWKIKALLVIKKVFGESDEKLKMIEALHYDYSSWSLRDQSGSKKSDTIKEEARGIIEAAILEISLEEKSNSVMDALKQEITGAQTDHLQQLIQQPDVTEKDVVEFIQQISSEIKDRVLARLVMNKDQ